MLLWIGKIIVGLFLAYAVHEVYVNVPPSTMYGVGEELPRIPLRKAEALFIIFPGFGGVDANTKRIEKAVLSNDRSHHTNRLVYTYDWSLWAKNSFRAAYDAEKVGRIVAQQLYDMHEKIPFSNLHVVGISVGAFAANACLDELTKLIESHNPHRLDQPMYELHTRLTLLDPFTTKGMFGHGYGERNFCKNAQYCEQFLNRDDNVPFTNTALSKAHVFDVTDCHLRDAFKPLPGDNMHSWPAAFFGLHWIREIDPQNHNVDSIYGSSHVSHPRGQITYVD